MDIRKTITTLRQIDTKGLVGWWKLYEGTAFDYSLNGNTGAVTNALPAYPGFSFAGADFININGVLTPAKTATGTITAWVNIVDTTGNQRIVSFGDTNGDEFFHLSLINDDLRARLKFAGNVWIAATTSDILKDGTWHHTAVVHDGTAAVIYVDGVLVQIATGATLTNWIIDLVNVDNVRIGNKSSDSSGETNFLTGKIDDVRIYNIDKSTVLIKSIYETTRGRYSV